MQSIEANPEVPAQPEHDLSDHGGAIGLEEAIERAPDAVVSQICQLLRTQSQQLGGELGGGLLHAVDRLALDQHGAQHQRQDGGVGDRQGSCACGHAALQDGGQSEPLDEVVDQWKGTDPLSAQREGSLDARGRLHDHLACDIVLAGNRLVKKIRAAMATHKPQERVQQIRARIERIRQELAALETLSSGTVLKRMKTCGNPNCGCHQDLDKRHGPYYEWTHLKAGKYTHRSLSAEQAAAMTAAIANHRKLQKLVTAWKAETEKLIETEHPREA